jgi:hypothetical protein
MLRSTLFAVSFIYASALALPQISLGLPPRNDRLPEIDRQCKEALDSVRNQINESQAHAVFDSNSASRDISVILIHKDNSKESWWRVENILKSKQYLISVGGQILESCHSFNNVDICVEQSECFRKVFIDKQGRVRLVELHLAEPDQLLN